jgi:hypothetical protein
MAEEHKFPTEVIDLPSEGKLYPKDSPLHGGKLELKYMTAREEDILTSQNLIKKGLVIEKLLEALIVTEGVRPDDLVLGDRNAIMVAARILAYGPEYETEIIDPVTEEKTTHIFNLADCPFKKLSSDVKSNEFKVTLPICKKEIKFKILTGKEDKKIDAEIKSRKKLGSDVSPELTTRLKHTIIEVDGSTDTFDINNFVDTLLSRDSLFLRREIQKVVPDIELKQTVEIGGETVEVDIPLSVNFFWPKS